MATIPQLMGLGMPGPLATALAGNNSAGGVTLISSAKITTPVTFFDVALPTGYDNFDLNLTDIVFSLGDALAFVISADNGVTWISDAVNADTYTSFLAIGVLAAATSLYPVYNGRVVVLPGSSHSLFGLMSLPFTSAVSNVTTLGSGPGSGDDPPGPAGAGLNPMATNRPVMRRYNKIRFFPQGPTQVFPPVSGETMTGTWSLFGYPSP